MKFKSTFLFFLIFLQSNLSLLGAHGFIRNVGQVRNQKGEAIHSILYTLSQKGQTIHFLQDGWDFYSYESIDSTTIKAYRLTCRFIGAQANAILEEGVKQAYSEHYYQNYLQGGPKHASSAKEFWIRGLYPGIDYHVFLDGEKLKYEFEIAEGASISTIQWQYSENVESSCLANQNIQLKTAFVELMEDAPVSYRSLDKSPIKSRFLKNDKGYWTYELEDGDITSYKRTIDPFLYWTSHYGGSGWDKFHHLEILDNGDLLSTGFTNSPSNISFQGYFSTLQGDYDMMLLRMSASGSPIWASYYGGSMFDVGETAFKGDNNSIFLIGASRSTGLHTRGSKQPQNSADADILIYRLDGNGTPIWSKYIGSDTTDGTYFSHKSKDGRFFYHLVFAYKDTLRFNSLGAPAHGWLSAPSLVKTDTAGNEIWSRIMGGNDYNYPGDLDETENGTLLLTLRTKSNNMGSSGSFAPNPPNGGGSFDNVLMAIDTSGTIKWSGYLGGAGTEGDSYVATKGADIYFLGSTNSTSGIALNVGSRQSSIAGDYDCFLSKLDTSGHLYWSCYLGGTTYDGPKKLEIDVDGNLIIAGKGSNPGFFNSSIQDSAYSLVDIFLVKLDSAGLLKWGTFLGSNGTEEVNGLCLTKNKIYLSGASGGTTGIFGTKRSFQPAFAGGSYDGIVLGILEELVYSQPTYDSVYCAGTTIKFPYTLADSMSITNAIRMQISDSSGNFQNAQILQSQGKYIPGSDTLRVNLPNNLKSSNHYRFRLLTTSPADTFYIQSSPKIISAPYGSITTSGNILCQSDSITLNWTGKNGVHYEWFNGFSTTGDTNSSIQTNNPGNYSLKVVSESGCAIKSNSFQIQQGIIPNARIYSTDSSICRNELKAQFADSSYQGIARQWYLNGQKVDTALVYTYSLSDTGTFVFALKSSSISGCSDSTFYTMQVRPLSRASFNLSDSFACLNEQNFLFQLPANHTYSMYQFTLGDTSSVFSLDSFGYSYVSSGTYPVKLKVENAFGCKDSTMKNIVVHAIPKANFNIVDTLFCSNLPATQFSNQSQNYLQSRWSFGDGDSSSYPNPSHAYTPGIYDVELVVRNAKGCRDTISRSLTMYAPPSVTIAYSDSMLCLGDSTLFQSNCDSSWNYFWSGSGMGCTQWVSDSSVHMLVVSDAQGCIDTAAAKVGIFPPIQQPVITQSSDTLLASSGYAIYRWFYEGSLLPSASGSIFIASQNGKYKVEVEDANGCMAQSSEFILSGLGLTEKNNLSLLIYPNPNKGTFKIKLENSEITTQVSIAIFNGLGQKMPCTTNLISTNEMEVKLNTVVPGIYYLKLVCKEKTYWKKVEVLPNSQ